MAPHVMSSEDAKEMVAFTKYPPMGSRPTCTGVRANQYTASSFSEHVEQSNTNILFLALIEDPSAVDAIDQILSVPGIDVVVPGPGDLSISLNVPGNFEHPLVIERVQKVIKSTLRSGKSYPGIYVSTTEQAKKWSKEGAKLVIYSIDTRVTFNAYREALLKLRSVLS
jgi:4-hydroxy-2-oxoheptanedioate aldolase